MSPTRLTSAVFACLLVQVSTVAAQSYPWNWNTPWGEWSDPESWSGKAPPDSFTLAYIGSGLAEVTTGGAVAGELTLGITLIGNGITGSGFLEIKEDGSLTAGDLRIASLGSGGNIPLAHEQYGRLLVSGENAGLAADEISVGMVGNGVLIVEDGAYTAGSSLRAGGVAFEDVDMVRTAFRADADIQVTGPGSMLQIESLMVIGTTGDAKLTIENGGAVYAESMTLGEDRYDAGGILEIGHGELLLSGFGSLLEMAGRFSQLNIGMSGTASIRIEDGAVFDYKSGSAYNAPIIGKNIGSEGLITVTGDGSLWRSASRINLGDGGLGILTIEDGGRVRAEAGITNADGSNFTARGSLIVRGAPEGSPKNPGVLETTFVSGAPNQTLQFDDAIVRALGNEANFIRGYGSRQIFEGGLVLDTDVFSVGITSSLSGLGALTKDGEGTLTMGVASSYAGGTVVDKGTLLVGVYGALGSGGIELAENAALGKSVTTSIDLTGHAITAKGDFTLASPGGSLFIGAVSVLKDDATLTLSPLPHTQPTSISFFINGRIETAGALSLQTTAEEAAAVIGFTTTNDFGGRLTVENGVTLNLSNFSGTSVNNDLQINEGAIVELLRNEQISDSHTTRVNGLLTFSTTSTLTETLGNLEGYGTIRSYQSDTGSWNQTLRVREGIFAGTMEDGGSASRLAFRKIDSGTLALLSTNTFSGATSIEGGTVLVGADGALGRGALAIHSGTTLGKSVISDLILTNTQTTLHGDATISSPGGHFRLTGLALAGAAHQLTLASASIVQTAEFTTEIRGALSGAGDLSLQTTLHETTAVVALTGTTSNTHTGKLSVGERVVLDLSKDDAIAVAGDLDIAAGGVVRISGNEQIADTSRVDVEGRLEFGAVRQATETIGYLNVSLDGVVSSHNAFGMVGPWNQTLRVYEGISYGTITDGSVNNLLNLEKIGSGDLVLGGYGNTYGGETHVREGTLILGNIDGSATGSGDVYVHEGAVLRGIGSIDGNVTISGDFYPGSSPGVVAIGGDLTFTETSFLQLDVWFGDTPGLTYDQVIVGGDLTFGGTLHIYFGLDYTYVGPIQFFQVAGTSNGIFANIELFGLPEGLDLEFDYATGQLMEAIPEPSTYTLIAIACALVYFVYRRKASATSKPICDSKAR